MEIFIAVISVICSLLTIILFFKVWGMCNDVDAIREKFVYPTITISELRFLDSIKDPSFDKMLARAIFDDLRNVFREVDYSEWGIMYDKHYKKWNELCASQGWQFPEFLTDKKTYKEFRDFFSK